ncbi:MAG: LamG domain-containing protein [Chlorobia bacterium]|nr:LamG domain-containing protein [Fimbriimonadaceae bacterium]
MIISSLIAFAALSKSQVQEPVLWLNPNGKVTIDGRSFTPRFAPGARVIRTQHGATYDFSGPRSGVHFGDLSQLKITDSMTVALWINPRSYVNDGPGAQILFRGDDRNGVDPYTLVIHGNGTINFGVQNAEDRGAHVGAELPLNRWAHIVANWDAETGFLRFWMNGELVGMTKTSNKPFADLDQGQAPGLSVGNVQNDRGRHNQPFNGMLADLRLYQGAWTPDDLGFGFGQRVDPPAPRALVGVD